MHSKPCFLFQFRLIVVYCSDFSNRENGFAISIASGNDINIKGGNVASEAGKADLAAENNTNIAIVE